MCKYTYHHYPNCGHIGSFTIDSCVYFLNALRTDTWAGADPKSCTNVREHHDLLNTTNAVYCGQCERDWNQRLLKDGIEAILHGPRPSHSPIEGLGLPSPILTTQMAMHLSQGPAFDHTFLNLDSDKESTASAASTPKPRFPTLHIPPPPSLPAARANPQGLCRDGMNLDTPHGETSAAHGSEINDYELVDTDMVAPQMISPLIKFEDDENDDDDDFESVAASDSDCADTEDRAAFVMRQLDKLLLPSFRANTAQKDEQDVARESSRASLRRTCPARTALLTPMYDTFPGFVPDRDDGGDDDDDDEDEEELEDAKDEDYWNDRTVLQSPVHPSTTSGTLPLGLGRDRGLLVDKYLPHAILANDIGGIVEKIGPDVQKFSVGDRIVGQSNILSGGADQAGLQQFCVLDAEYAAPIPSALSFDQAATIPVNAMASFIALFDASGLELAPAFLGPLATAATAFDYRHEAIVIIGGGSNCGKFALQFARLAGFGKIITTAKIRDGSERSLRDLGATHVIDRDAADVEDQIRALVGDDLLYAFDPVNGAHQLALELLSTTKKGSLATLVRGEADPVIAARKRAGFKKNQILGVSDVHKELAAQFWRELPGWIEAGKLQPLDYTVIDGLDAGKVNSLLDDYRDGRPVVKTHVHPNNGSLIENGQTSL
ncbi:zinc-binding alcohol dehydrogenase family protein [Aspergillus clavatus NRRL 1]|uniref:Zinc-binding dehydrogenase family oxidoreductase, putative n=1 Tax=Aspergillus clavatus (strain ATCC 1007 / CBS 513.65 / DSM 816 / NCTC 3887 / NRRL 1 / QM 1276 / 107) TaxID=344612 RepID=A1CAY0_ASPCL|nr:zinc-binding dehydrogenase family oxidoreductase, putative [Aspergillus clavatus NRRL 1]EAW12898.1 zinc-binding dehydrogenase family oxidoreductase, putative [Aspergillus clavatus NRRL 1]